MRAICSPRFFFLRVLDAAPYGQILGPTLFPDVPNQKRVQKSGKERLFHASFGDSFVFLIRSCFSGSLFFRFRRREKSWGCSAMSGTATKARGSKSTSVRTLGPQRLQVDADISAFRGRSHSARFQTTAKFDRAKASSEPTIFAEARPSSEEQG